MERASVQSLLEERNLEGTLPRWLVHERLSPPATRAEARLGVHQGQIHLEYLMNLAVVDLRTPWRPVIVASVRVGTLRGLQDMLLLQKGENHVDFTVNQANLFRFDERQGTWDSRRRRRTDFTLVLKRCF